MAEPLGSAELILTVNDQALRQGLADARRLLGDLQTDVNRTATRTRRAQRTAGGGTGGGGADGINRRSTRGSVRQVGSPTFTARGVRQGGPREDFRALEKAQERRFRLSQRIETLEERGAQVSRLRSRLGQLTQAQSNRQFGTFRQISQELSRQVTLAERRVRLAEQAQRAEQQAARIGAKQGGARESIDALTNAQKRRYRLDQQIRSLEAAGVRTDNLRAQLGEATTAQARRQFGSFNQIADSLDFTLRKERDRLRVIRDQNREIERQATEGRRIGRLNASPVRGGIAFPGSPGALAASQAEGLRIGRLNASPVRGGLGFPGSPADKAAQKRAQDKDEQKRRKAFREQLAEGRRIGRLNTAPVRGGAAFPGSPAANEAIVSRNLKVRSSWSKALDFLDETASLIAFNAKASAQKEGLRIGRLNASPLRGRTSVPGSPAFLDSIFPDFPKDFFAQQKRETAKQDREAAARSKRGRDATSSAIIGGAFPLLFGQGIGASLGGAAGGAAGGALGGQFGFGLSLVGTALGAQFDLAIQKTQTLAKALDDPIGQFAAVQQNALLSSKGLEKHVASLIAQGREAEAAALIQKDLANSYVDPKRARDLAAATDQLNRAYTQLSLAFADIGLEPIAALATDAATALRGFAATLQFIKENTPDLPIPRGGQVGSSFFNPLSGGFGTAAIIEGGKGLNRVFGRPPAQNFGAPQFNMDAEFKQIAKRLQGEKDFLALKVKENQLVQAQAQGYAGLEANLQRQVILETARLAVIAEPENKLKIEAEARKELVALAEREVQRLQELNAQRQLDAAQNAIKAQSIAEQVRNTQALAAAEKGVERQTLATIQAVQTGVAEARRREQALGAQIDAARLRGGDAGEQEAARLVGEQRLAANETRLELEKGALALKEAGEQLRDNIRAGVVEFTRVRSDPQGLNRFLNSQQRQQRAEVDFQTLLPAFREAQARFTQLTGARAPEFSGSTSGVNDAIRNFIESVAREFDTTKELNASLKAASDINAQLISVNTQLATVTQELAAKRWDVNLILPNGSSVPYANEQNAAFPL